VCTCSGGVASFDDEVGDNLVEDAKSFRERFLGKGGVWRRVAVSMEEMAH
jgi:hypothetical protein